MMVFTAKFSKKKMISLLAVVLAAICIIAVIIALPARGKQIDIGTEEQRVDYIQDTLGYIVVERLNTRQVNVPKVFTDVYIAYNELQKQQGFDLTKYSGKQAMLYTYQIGGYEGETNVLIDLLAYRDKLIGGSIYTAAIDGFMTGLCPKGS